MRIISTFHDYYDVGKRWDRENYPIYQRHDKEIHLPDLKMDYKYPNLYKTAFSLVKIGFCGLLYPCLEKLTDAYPLPREYHYLENPDLDELELGWFTEKWLYDSWNSKGELELFEKFSTPIFVVHHLGRRVTLHPNLTEYQFYKLKDPFTTYQELSVYIGSRLVADQQGTQTIPDISLVESKGFDKIKSFRKEKHERKSRKNT